MFVWGVIVSATGPASAAQGCDLAGGRPAVEPPPVEPPVLADSESVFEGRAYSRINVFKRVLSDQQFLVTQWWPSEIRNTQFAAPMVFGVALAATGREGEGADQRLEASAHGNAGPGTRRMAHRFTSLGNAATTGLLIGSAYFIGRWSGDDRMRETASLSTEALLDTGIWVTALKTVTARTRPAANGQGDFFEYQTNNRQVNGSFPSGHAMGAFAVATVLAHEYSDKRWVPWTAYGVAGLISYSRLTLGRHFPSDIIVGAALGNSMGRMVWSRARGERSALPGRITPIFDSSHKAYGLSWSHSW